MRAETGKNIAVTKSSNNVTVDADELNKYFAEVRKITSEEQHKFFRMQINLTP